MRKVFDDTIKNMLSEKVNYWIKTRKSRVSFYRLKGDREELKGFLYGFEYKGYDFKFKTYNEMNFFIENEFITSWL